MFRRTTRAIFALVAALALVAGCDSSKSKTSGDESGAAQASAGQESGEEGEQGSDHHEGEGHADDEHHDDHHEGEGHADDEHHGEHHDDHHEGEGDEQAAKGEGEMVDVPKDGEKFDPAVKASRIPEGVWHCNMKGKVHYAAQKKGNGECPVCGMDLKEK